jgi:nucleoside-diphosphate-sugar epimerase
MPAQIDNVRYTVDAVNAAHALGCKVFVGAGSQAEYGRVEGKLTAETPCFPENGYGMAKLCAGQMSRELCHALGIRHNWVRILSVYGPYDTQSSMVMSTITALKEGQIPRFTKGEQIWDYLYSEDAARGLLAVAERGKDGRVYCLGSGEGRQLREYIEKIRNAVSPNAPIGMGELPYSPKQITYLSADTRELERDTGFRARVSFDEGIEKTLEWYDSAYS